MDTHFSAPAPMESPTKSLAPSDQETTNTDRITTEGTLLEVQFSDNQLRLRVGKNGITLGDEEEPTVVTLTLSGCTTSSEVREFLSRVTGEWMWYECYPSEQAIGTTIACFYEDYHDTTEVVCAEATEVISDYTTEELLHKCRQLSSLYLDAADRESKISKEYDNFTRGLRAGVKNEIARCRWKLGFFSSINPLKATAMQAQVSAYERVLTLMAFQGMQK